MSDSEPPQDDRSRRMENAVLFGAFILLTAGGA
jgi:hypothetical protein